MWVSSFDRGILLHEALAQDLERVRQELSTHVRRCLKGLHQASCSRSMQREEKQVSPKRSSIQNDGAYLRDGPVDTFQNPFLLLSRLVLLLPLSVLLLDLLDFGTTDLTGSYVVSRSVSGKENVKPYPSLYANSWYVG